MDKERNPQNITLTFGIMFSSGPLDPDEFAINHRQQIDLTTFVSNM
jgi:hypothetical protein